MRFEYILLLILSVFPLIYKLWYWQHIFKLHSYNMRDFLNFLPTKQGRESMFHFWTSLEFPIFILAFVPLIDKPFEYFFYSIFFYFLVLYNIFVLGKILRKKIYLPEKNALSYIIFSIIIFLFSLPILFPLSIYLYISSVLLWIPVLWIMALLIIKYVLPWLQTPKY